MTKPATFLVTGLLVLGWLSAPAHAADDPSMRDWSVKANPSLEKSPPAQDDIRKFVNKILDAQMNPTVCSYKFLDVARDGNVRLFASLDSSGRHFCNEMVVIGKDGAHFSVINQWKVWGVDDIATILRDVDHDGREELVLPQSWTVYDGASHCLATWQKIYQWENGKFVDHSASFPDFYKTRLQELKTLLEANMGYGRDAPCTQMEMDKINRFLLIEPRAGLTRAEDWMKSPDASLRRKSAAVFADIGDAEARDDLMKLTLDSDPLVAETAKLYISGGAR